MDTEATDGERPEDGEACPGCGLTRRGLYARGEMGCARCYQTFTAEVNHALREIHGETRHLGKNAA
jgi:protein arginine kinase activator